MTRHRRRAHALLPRSRGQAGEPFLPEVGQIYQINTIIYTFGIDPAPERPAVVVAVPPDPESMAPLRVVTRTSQPVPGIAHPADRSLRLNKDGVFSDLVTVERSLWRPGNVELVGVLPERYLALVMERFS